MKIFMPRFRKEENKLFTLGKGGILSRGLGRRDTSEEVRVALLRDRDGEGATN